jgi:NAD(P)H-hydrate repair Nnr-like enzyme with NAD(P)H-hydrate dehydratase domain
MGVDGLERRFSSPGQFCSSAAGRSGAAVVSAATSDVFDWQQEDFAETCGQQDDSAALREVLQSDDGLQADDSLLSQQEAELWQREAELSQTACGPGTGVRDSGQRMTFEERLTFEQHESSA